LADEPKIPKVVGDAFAMSSLRLSAVEGFILSRIDGRLTESDLASLTGLSNAQIASTLEKLESFQVITRSSIAASAPTKAASGPVPVTASSSQTASSPVSSPAVAGGPSSTSDASSDPANIAKRVRRAMAAISADAPELAEEVDLPRELRLHVLGASAVIDSLDYYEMLAVERTADKKTIKRAYFALAAIFHPDRYFRKTLGSYKLRMEALFARATLAHDSLTNKERRAEYDEYLIDLDRTRGIEDLLRGAAEEAERAEQDALRSAGRASLPDITVAPNGSPVPTKVAADRTDKISGFYPAPGSIEAPGGSVHPSGSPSRPSASPTAPQSVGPLVSEQAKRDALAMRLLGSRTMSSRGMPRVVTTPAPPTPPPVVARAGGDAVEALKRRYEERVELARRVQADKYVALAREAEAGKDVVGAAAAYKVALGFLTEGDPNFAVANAAIAKADQVLSETYIRQAAYEDRAEQWVDAAKSWQRVIRGRPGDARAYERAANALCKSKGDLHLAVQLAQRAVQLEPANADYKIALATVFIEAGLLLNARRELEAAAQLSPRNATIGALLKRVHKAG
jgi:tetratricopeptide (TPR) repeat protein